MESSSLNHLHSRQLFEEQLRNAEQVRRARAAESERQGTARMGWGRIRTMFESARRGAARRPSLTAVR